MGRFGRSDPRFRNLEVETHRMEHRPWKTSFMPPIPREIGKLGKEELLVPEGPSYVDVVLSLPDDLPALKAGSPLTCLFSNKIMGYICHQASNTWKAFKDLGRQETEEVRR